MNKNEKIANINESKTFTTEHEQTFEKILKKREDINLKSRVVTLRKLKKMIDNKEITWDIPEQRNYIAEGVFATMLIISGLLGYEIGAIIVFFKGIIDGQQRTRSLIEFINNQRKFMGLEGEYECLNGLKFKDLPKKYQNAILSIKVRIEESENPDIDRAEEFKRFNAIQYKMENAEKWNSEYFNNYGWEKAKTLAKNNNLGLNFLNPDDLRFQTSQLYAGLLSVVSGKQKGRTLYQSAKSWLDDIQSGAITNKQVDKAAKTLEKLLNSYKKSFNEIPRIRKSTETKGDFLAFFLALNDCYEHDKDTFSKIVKKRTSKNIIRNLKTLFLRVKDEEKITDPRTLNTIKNIKDSLSLGGGVSSFSHLSKLAEVYARFFCDSDELSEDIKAVLNSRLEKDSLIFS